jgi:hypothetical protein
MACRHAFARSKATEAQKLQQEGQSKAEQSTLGAEISEES